MEDVTVITTIVQMGKLRQRAGKGNTSSACWLLDPQCSQGHPSEETSDIPTLARPPVAEPLMGHTHPQAVSSVVSPGLLFRPVHICRVG